MTENDYDTVVWTGRVNFQKKERELNERIGKLNGTQARIALQTIASGKSLEEALDIAETY